MQQSIINNTPVESLLTADCCFSAMKTHRQDSSRPHTVSSATCPSPSAASSVLTSRHHPPPNIQEPCHPAPTTPIPCHQPTTILVPYHPPTTIQSLALSHPPLTLLSPRHPPPTLLMTCHPLLIILLTPPLLRTSLLLLACGLWKRSLHFFLAMLMFQRVFQARVVTLAGKI